MTHLIMNWNGTNWAGTDGELTGSSGTDWTISPVPGTTTGSTLTLKAPTEEGYLMLTQCSTCEDIYYNWSDNPIACPKCEKEDTLSTKVAGMTIEDFQNAFDQAIQSQEENKKYSTEEFLKLLIAAILEPRKASYQP